LRRKYLAERTDIKIGKPKSAQMDSNYLYLLTSDQVLYLYRHSLPGDMSPFVWQAVLPYTSEFALLSYKFNHLISLNTDNTVSLFSPFEHTSTFLSCTIYPKQNEYEIQVNAYTSWCPMKAEETEESSESYCIVSKFFTVEADIPKAQPKKDTVTTVVLFVAVPLFVFLAGAGYYWYNWIKSKYRGEREQQYNEVTSERVNRWVSQIVDHFPPMGSDDEDGEGEGYIREGINSRRDGFASLENDFNSSFSQFRREMTRVE